MSTGHIVHIRSFPCVHGWHLEPTCARVLLVDITDKFTGGLLYSHVEVKMYLLNMGRQQSVKARPIMFDL